MYNYKYEQQSRLKNLQFHFKDIVYFYDSIYPYLTKY